MEFAGRKTEVWAVIMKFRPYSRSSSSYNRKSGRITEVQYELGEFSTAFPGFQKEIRKILPTFRKNCRETGFSDELFVLPVRNWLIPICIAVSSKMLLICCQQMPFRPGISGITSGKR